jgi:hypothetical protein
MAKQILSGEPIGKRISSEYDRDRPLEIVGAIDDIKEGPLDMKPTAAVYTPFSQNPMNDFFLTLRTSRSERTLFPSTIKAIRQVDRGLSADGQDTMTERISNPSRLTSIGRPHRSLLALR